MYMATPTTGGGFLLAGLAGFAWSAMLGASLIVIGLSVLGITKFYLGKAELEKQA